MRLFSRKSALERQLEKRYAEMLLAFGVRGGQAKRIAKELVALAKKGADSNPQPPPNFGDLLLQREGTDSDARDMLAKKRAEGVGHTDIKWWWNLNELERRLLITFDDWVRLAAYKKHCSSGLSAQQAAAQVRKSFPIFGDPGDTADVTGDDRPLPYELKDRINAWVQRQQMADPAGFAVNEQSATSMNAVIRREMRAGKL